MSDPYRGIGDSWQRDVSLVYRPLAIALAGRHPGPLRGLRIVDVGAGTGLGSAALRDVGAHTVAVDRSADMVRLAPPPALVGDVTRLPLAASSVDGVLAAFVLNHLTLPAVGLAEMRRVTKPGGHVLASVYAGVSSNGVRDVVDGVARRAGFAEPEWCGDLKENRAPRVSSPELLAGAARDAGLDVVECVQEPVDVGVDTAEDLVRYRFGQAQYAPWLAAMPAAAAAEIRAAAVAAARPVMEPYRPLVIMLVARKS